MTVALALAVALLAPAQSPKEVVALPLTEDGLEPPAGLDAWGAVVTELRKRAKRLGLSTSMQKKRHDFLVGPAKEQARDCGNNAECLAEIGTALGVDILIAGTVAKKSVSLVAIDVASKAPIGKGRSTGKITSRVVKKKARAAMRSLARSMSAAQKKAAKAAKAELAAKKKAAKEAAAAAKQAKKSGGDKKSGADKKSSDGKVGEGDAKKTTVAKGGDLKGGDGSGGGATPPPSDVPPPSQEGSILIEKSQLAGVTEVQIDGTVVSFTGAGNVEWSGAAGTHTLVAKKIDGSRFKKDVEVNPQQITRVALEFPVAVTKVPPPKSDPGDEGESIYGKWWFWTAIGGAVVGGAVTAAVLAGGDKGGPNVEGDTGTIRGTY